MAQVSIVQFHCSGILSRPNIVLQIFKDTLGNRKKRWEIFRSHISSRAKAQFTYLLSERSFRGRLLADHSEKRLDLQVRISPPVGSGS